MGIHAQPREIDVPKDDPFKHDLLDRREAVDTLTHLVANLDGPCVLGVDAAWGAGKTTFLRMWTQYLRNQGFPVVEFNAWETDYSEEPFVTLSTELTEGLRLGKTKLPDDIGEGTQESLTGGPSLGRPRGHPIRGVARTGRRCRGGSNGCVICRGKTVPVFASTHVGQRVPERSSEHGPCIVGGQRKLTVDSGHR